MFTKRPPLRRRADPEVLDLKDVDMSPAAECHVSMGNKRWDITPSRSLSPCPRKALVYSISEQGRIPLLGMGTGRGLPTLSDLRYSPQKVIDQRGPSDFAIFPRDEVLTTDIWV